MTDRSDSVNLEESSEAAWPGEPTPEAVLDALAMREAADVDDGEVLAAARCWSRELAGRRSSGEPVDLWVAGRFACPTERQLWAWSILDGAGLILPGADARRVATVLWARPTVVSGDRAEIARLVKGLRERRESRLLTWNRRIRGEPVLPMGRLHTVVVAGRESLADDDRAWLEAAGVRVLHECDYAAP